MPVYQSRTRAEECAGRHHLVGIYPPGIRMPKSFKGLGAVLNSDLFRGKKLQCVPPESILVDQIDLSLIRRSSKAELGRLLESHPVDCSPELQLMTVDSSPPSSVRAAGDDSLVRVFADGTELGVRDCGACHMMGDAAFESLRAFLDTRWPRWG